MVAQDTKEPLEIPSRGGLGLRSILILVVILAVAGGIAVLTMGSGNPRPTISGIRSAVSSRFRGSLISPAKPAPPLSLHNYNGQPVNIDQYRGKAVLVTFLYTNCPDVCPIIASNLGTALKLMGPTAASKVQIIAVSVDPLGDTPKAVSAFLTRHGMAGRMQYLIGSAAELGRAWRAWGVGSERDAQQPQLVNHQALVYGISGSGKLTTVYLTPFAPAEVAHDIPLLASV